eukprot:SAG11_NODE_21229_length_429_cov_0.933333_1_plen_125_part_01
MLNARLCYGLGRGAHGGPARTQGARCGACQRLDNRIFVELDQAAALDADEAHDGTPKTAMAVQLRSRLLRDTEIQELVAALLSPKAYGHTRAATWSVLAPALIRRGISYVCGAKPQGKGRPERRP